MNDKDKYSSLTLGAMIACSMLASIMLIGYITSKAGHDSWLIVLIGLVAFLPVLGVYIQLAGKFPGKSLIEIINIIYGKIGGKIISSLYIFYFFLIAFTNADLVGEFIVGNVMPETPKVVILILFMLLCGYAVRKGSGGITRVSVFFTAIVFVAFVANGMLLMGRIKFDNFLPVLQKPVYPYFQATLTMVSITFSGALLVFMLLPKYKTPQNIKKPLLGGTLVGTLMLLVVIVRDIAVLGETISYLASPAYEAVRLINLADILTRMEVVYACILMTLLFFKVSLSAYACLKSIEETVRLKSYKPIVYPLAGLVVCFALASFDSPLEQAAWGASYAGYFSTIFIVILPIVTAIVAAVRGFKKPKEGNTP